MEFWQRFEAIDPTADATLLTDTFPARMPDGSWLVLPLRDLGAFAVAGLIANQASFTVIDHIAGWMGERVRDLQPDIVVGLPTLGHVIGAATARALGHRNWAAPGTSRKLWYDDALSVPLSSVTAPASGRRMWLDPRLVQRLHGRRVLLVDDVISTGSSARAGLDLLEMVGVRPVAIAVAMIQTQRWRDRVPAGLPVIGAFTTPLFRPMAQGWVPVY